YLNLPLDEAGYHAFVQALLAAEKVTPHAFEEARYFEGCLPIEVMAERGAETLAHGPMKPVGLVDPRTARRPHAVVELRQAAGGGAGGGGGGGAGPQRGGAPPPPHLAGAAAHLPHASGAGERGVPPDGADPPEHIHRRAPAARVGSVASGGAAGVVRRAD